MLIVLTGAYNWDVVAAFGGWWGGWCRLKNLHSTSRPVKNCATGLSTTLVLKVFSRILFISE
jgi:hypothetical protein